MHPVADEHEPREASRLIRKGPDAPPHRLMPRSAARATTAGNGGRLVVDAASGRGIEGAGVAPR